MIIERFGDTWATAVELPSLNVRHDAGGIRTSDTRQAVPGGRSVDYGRPRSRHETHTLPYAGLCIEDSEAAMDALAATYRSLGGLRSRLWRSDGTDHQWKVARCTRVSVDYDPRMGLAQAGVQFTFALADGPWYGDAQQVIDVLDADKDLVLPNDGDHDVDDVTITVVPVLSGSGILFVTRVGSSSIRWQGTLTATEPLVINCRERTVRLNGTDAYVQDFLAAAHAIPEWLLLPPGDSDVNFTRSGAFVDAEVTVDYADSWA